MDINLYILNSLILIIFYIVFKIWMEGESYSKKFRIDGKVVLITGANSGIGKETAIELAKRGAKVIMACREWKTSKIAQQEIINKSGNTNVHLMIVDLASFESIKSFAKEFSEKEPILDVLINNAGVLGMNKTLTENGLEMHMGVNYFGHFLLTLLLLDKIKQSKPSRIINVSSMAESFYRFNMENWNSQKYYNRFEAYCQSKLANIMFTKELSNRLKNTGVTVNALHPGVIQTNLSRHLSSFCFLLSKTFCNVFSKIFLRSTKSGAQCTIFLAVDFNLQTITGQYFRNGRFSRPNKDVFNDNITKWLWDKSAEVTGVNCDYSTNN